MAPKLFKQSFANNEFTGLDGQSTAIEPEGVAASLATNLEMAPGNSLRGRLGCQSSSGNNYGFFAIFPYTYSRVKDQYDIVYQVGSGVHPNEVPTLSTTKTAADGATIRKLIAINQQMWVLDTLSFTVTYASGTYPFSWYIKANEGTANLEFVLKANGVALLTSALGAFNLTKNIYTLLGEIDALPELAISRTTRGTCPPFAIVNGNQTTAGAAAHALGAQFTATVFAGHTFLRGDVITFISGSSGGLIGGVVTATTANTITYVGPQVVLANNDILGYMNQTAASFPIGPATSVGSGNLTLSFPYWRLIPEGDSTYISSVQTYGKPFKPARDFFISNYLVRDSNFTLPTNANQNGCLYIGTAASPSYDITSYYNNVIKTDGVSLYRVGGGRKHQIYLTPIAAGALTGTYKYKAFLRRYDAQGNIIDGVQGYTASVTYAGQYGQVQCDNDTWVQAEGWQGRGGFKNTNESPAAGASFYVDDGGGGPAFIQPGDPVYLTDNTSQKAGLYAIGGFGATPIGTLHKTVCTAYDSVNLSMKVADSSGYQINNNTAISVNTTVVILRTTAGGNQFYVLAEVPAVGGSASFSMLDNVTDATLTAGEQYIEPTLGKEHDPPPAAALVCEHQGGLVLARGVTGANANGYFTTCGSNGVAFSSADGSEYFPIASNTFDVPATQSGPITAVASDTNDRLAVFKENAYYDVMGDLDGGAFSVNVKNDGDFGITSQASIARIPGALIGLSKIGFVIVNDGLLDPYRFQELNARIVNQPLYFQNATGVNDPTTRAYCCTIPTDPDPTTGFASYTIDYSRGDIRTLDRLYANNCDQAGGIVPIGDNVFHLSRYSGLVFRRLPRFDGNSPSGNGDGDSFIDQISAIPYTFETNAINMGEPGQLKTPIRLRIWSIPNNYVNEGWIPFTITVKTAASPVSTLIGTLPGASSSVTFSTDADVYKDVKLPNCKTHFYIVQFKCNTIRQSPFITGWELMFAEDYEKEDFIK